MELEDYEIEFEPEKNLWLRENRGICFDDVLPLIDEGMWLSIYNHPRQDQYPGQKIMVFLIQQECYLVPFVENNEDRKIFLKTLYPSRKARKHYLKDRK